MEFIDIAQAQLDLMWHWFVFLVGVYLSVYYIARVWRWSVCDGRELSGR